MELFSNSFSDLKLTGYCTVETLQNLLTDIICKHSLISSVPIFDVFLWLARCSPLILTVIYY